MENYKFYSIWDKQTGRFLNSGLNSNSKDKAIEAGIEYIISGDEDNSDTKKIKNMSIQDKENFLGASELEIQGHNNKEKMD